MKRRGIDYEAAFEKGTLCKRSQTLSGFGGPAGF